MIEPTDEASVRVGCPVRREPHVDALVSRTNAPGRLDHPGDEKPEADREHRDRRQTGEHHDDEDDRRVKLSKHARQPFRRPPLRAPRTAWPAVEPLAVQPTSRCDAQRAAACRMCFHLGHQGMFPTLRFSNRLRPECNARIGQRLSEDQAIDAVPPALAARPRRSALSSELVVWRYPRIAADRRRRRRSIPRARSARRSGDIRSLRAFLDARLDPAAATGLALTLALVFAIGGGVLLGVLAYLVRTNSHLIGIDNGVAKWGNRHASTMSTHVLNAVTQLGSIYTSSCSASSSPSQRRSGSGASGSWRSSSPSWAARRF